MIQVARVLVDSGYLFMYYRRMNTTARHIDELMTEDTVFISPVGSRLYGLENADSDYDYFVIRDCHMNKSRHTISDDYDLRIFTPILMHEMLMRKPTHTALEALYSPLRVMGPRASLWMPFLDGFRPSFPELRRTFISTALGTLSVKDEAKFKRFRLGLYLAQKYWEARDNDGYYNPRLAAAEAATLTARAEELFALPEDARRDILLAELGEPRED